MTQQIPEGWYPDPQKPGAADAERWWNGVQWTAHTRSTPAGAPSYPAPSVPAQSGEGMSQAPRYGEQNAGWRPQTAPPTRGSLDLPDGRRLADIGTRLGAYLIDLVIVFLVVAPLRLVLGMLDDGVIPDSRFMLVFNLRDSLAGAGMLVVYVLYQVFFLRRRGATPGRSMVGLRVEPEPGSTQDRPETGPLVLRALVLAGPFYPQTFPVLGALGYFLPLVAIIMAANNRWRQGPHDTVAHTVVVSRPR